MSLGAGELLNFFGVGPLQALRYTAVLYGLTAPVMVAIVPPLANNRAVVGEFTNDPVANALGGITLLLMSAAAGLLLYFQFFA